MDIVVITLGKAVLKMIILKKKIYKRIIIITDHLPHRTAMEPLRLERGREGRGSVCVHCVEVSILAPGEGRGGPLRQERHHFSV